MEDVVETNGISMGDFMDVIMTYKCKFCMAVCNSAQEMTSHIKQVHITVVDNINDEVKDFEPDNLPIKLDSSSTGITAQDAVDPNNTNRVEECFTGKHTTESYSDVVQSTISTATTTSISGDPKYHLEQVNLEGGEHYTLTKESFMDHKSQLNTKLLYVCGQCSVGFNSIEDCNEHMLESHGQPTASVGVPDDNLDMEQSPDKTFNQVSVGTQMEPKKKKKKVLIKKEPVTSEESDDDDKDWIPENKAGRARRKTRPPRALKEVYYMEKKKKMKRKKLINGVSCKHKCPFYGCMAKFTTSENLETHTSCHNTNNNLFTCIHCKHQYNSWRIMRLHLHRSHGIDLDLLTCELCGFKIDTMNKLRVHQEIHSESRPYTCDVCGKGFRQYSQMKNHQLIHAQYQKKEEDQTVICDVCERSFVNKKCLIKHQQTVHSNEKPFKCNWCSYCSTRKSMLTLHLRIHTGEKPFKCDLCAYASGDHNSLRRHKMRHTGQKQYKCSFCPYSCIQAISLKSHLRAKHPGNDATFVCTECSYQTVSKAALEKHMIDHKNGLVTLKPKRNKTPVINAEDIGQNEYFNFTENPDSMQVKMHVQTMKTGEAQVSAEDLAKLSCYEGLMTGEVSAAQLIYSALNAIGQCENTGVPQTAELLGGVQCTTVSAECDEGVTSHTITFHLPATFQSAEQQGEAVLFGQPVEIIETVDESAVQFIESNIIDASGQVVACADTCISNQTEPSDQYTDQSIIIIGQPDGQLPEELQNAIEMVEEGQQLNAVRRSSQSEPLTDSNTLNYTDSNQTSEILTVDLQQIVQE